MSKIASKPENEEKRASISDQASAIYVKVCKEFKNKKPVKVHKFKLEEEPLSLVAEPNEFAPESVFTPSSGMRTVTLSMTCFISPL